MKNSKNMSYFLYLDKSYLSNCSDYSIRNCMISLFQNKLDCFIVDFGNHRAYFHHFFTNFDKVILIKYINFENPSAIIDKLFNVFDNFILNFWQYKNQFYLRYFLSLLIMIYLNYFFLKHS